MSIIGVLQNWYENKSFNSVYIMKSDSCWFECDKKNGIFIGCGGIQNLGDILNVFYSWVKDSFLYGGII